MNYDVLSTLRAIAIDRLIRQEHADAQWHIARAKHWLAASAKLAGAAVQVYDNEVTYHNEERSIHIGFAYWYDMQRITHTNIIL